MGFIAAGLVSALVLVSGLRLHPVDAAANAALLVHAALLFAGNGVRARQTRLAYAFLEIVLAAALNPEARTAVLIFIYFAAVSQLLTLNYLERMAPSLPRTAVNRMLRFSLASALVTFLVSLATAPLLPKLRAGLAPGAVDFFPLLTPGYTESVDMAAFGRWAPGGSAPALRLIPPRDIALGALVQALPHKLLRGRVLEHFDGSRWLPIPSGASGVLAPEVGALVLEIQREPTGSHGIPVPYGTVAVGEATGEETGASGKVFQHRASGDWMSWGSGLKRLRYLTYLSVKGRDGTAALAPRDRPGRGALELPVSWRNPSASWAQLRAEVFHGGRDVTAMAAAAEAYFAESGRYVGGPNARAARGSQVPVVACKAPLRNFFSKRAGVIAAFTPPPWRSSFVRRGCPPGW